MFRATAKHWPHHCLAIRSTWEPELVSLRFCIYLGQNLQHHPHLHCVVPGGGLAETRSLGRCRPGILLPVRVLSRCSGAWFLEMLEKAYQQGELRSLLS